MLARRRIINPIQECRHNERVALSLLRVHQSASKANLARLTGLTAAAVGGIITSLSDKGLVEMAGKLQGDMGQPATLFRLSPEGAYGLGVSINRGNIETLLINFVGEKVAVRRHDVILPKPEVVVKMVLEDIESIIQEIPAENIERIAGIGIAQPYHLESWTSQGVEAWKEWENFDIGSALSEATGFPSTTENDGNAAVLAELVYGVGREERDFLYLFLGSPLVESIGGGVVIDGACRSGYTGNAGDLGLIPVPNSQIPTSKSSEEYQGTFLSSRSSLNSLVLYLSSKGAEITNREELAQAIQRHPNEVNDWLDDSISALETAVYGVQAVLDLPYIIIDGEDDDAAIITRIIDSLGGRLSSAYRKSRPMPKIRKGVFGSEASAIGAATIPLDSNFSPKTNGKP